VCGILSILDIKGDPKLLRSLALRLAKRLRHRGPDWSGVYSDERAILAHERLAIVDVMSGSQPLIDSERATVLTINGEIYNHKELRKCLRREHPFRTASDCEVILYLYDEMGVEFLNLINGIFAFVLYDPKADDYLIARDHIGIVPLYIGFDADGNFFVSSELQGIQDHCKRVEEFPPGHYYLGKEKKMRRYYQPSWAEDGQIPQTALDLNLLRDSLERAVKRQLMSDVPYGVLISGGVDSSIVAAIAAKYRANRIETNDRDPAWWPTLHSFSVGIQGLSPDLTAARKVADFIGSTHHEIFFTVQEALDAISDVIYHLETFDVTTIRAGTPMYLMARKIRAMGIKMILSGEGADEIFGGYLYFHKAPNAVEFQEELVRKIKMLHEYDCLRANKAMAAWGVEARVPFLDREFLDIAMNINPSAKMCGSGKMEKTILRQAFQGFIPDEILWRQKEQFSDGVGYSWIDSLKAYAENEVSDKLMANAMHRFPVKTPNTKEGYWFRTIFEHHFANPSVLELIPDGPSVACSTPTAIRWDATFSQMADPSGRAVRDVHKAGLTAP